MRQATIYRDTAANFTANNPTLSNGDVGIETDTKRTKQGDGTTAWANLAYSAIGQVPKVYRALLAQAGVAAPTATVLENTLGGTVVWTYVDVGTYLGTLVGAFGLTHTFAFGQIQPCINDTEAFAQITAGTDSVALNILNLTGQTTDSWSGVLEILVYP